jgi:hypothetical protein
MRDLDVVVESLEQLAEREGDIAAEVYERFFASCGSAVPLMGHSDVHMRGRMLDEVFGLLMDEVEPVESSYLRWEVGNHVEAYGVEVEMYDAFLNSLKDTVQAGLGETWDTRYEGAWHSRIQSLLSAISRDSGSETND